MVFSPSLDIFGYGKTKTAANKSFEVSLGEFLRYTNNKKTFTKELKRLGWMIRGSKKKPKIKAPSLSELLSSNEQFNEIFNEGEYHKYDQTISVPALV